ncbi:MAG: hypothetical protein U5L75_03320 [Candidatus Campbellbacteria bacterium]|nr:hypothetical protein [Candidatus Campbellbacteria bacterium]
MSNDQEYKYNGNEYETPEEAERRRAAEKEAHLNSPDEILEEADSLEESQTVQGEVGDNLTEQFPTKDQTAGESATGGKDDEEFGSSDK